MHDPILLRPGVGDASEAHQLTVPDLKGVALFVTNPNPIADTPIVDYRFDYDATGTAKSVVPDSVPWTDIVIDSAAKVAAAEGKRFTPGMAVQALY